jgi:hypothetical protein
VALPESDVSKIIMLQTKLNGNHKNETMFFIVAVRQHTLYDIVIKQYLSIPTKDKPIPNSYPQLQGNVEEHNKIVKNEFISVKLKLLGTATTAISRTIITRWECQNGINNNGLPILSISK